MQAIVFLGFLFCFVFCSCFIFFNQLESEQPIRNKIFITKIWNRWSSKKLLRKLIYIFPFKKKEKNIYKRKRKLKRKENKTEKRNKKLKKLEKIRFHLDWLFFPVTEQDLHRSDLIGRSVSPSLLFSLFWVNIMYIYK